MYKFYKLETCHSQNNLLHRCNLQDAKLSLG